MKLKLLRWLLPAIIPAALMFGVATSAQATQYNCDGPINPVPTHVNGDADVSSEGDCIIDHSITATGAITFNVTGSLYVTGNLTAQGGNIGMNVLSDIVIQGTGNISSGTTVYIKSVNGLVNVIGRVRSNTLQVANSQGNVLIQAAGKVATGDIITSGNVGPTTPLTGSVQIDANMNGANVPFVIGGSGGDNGINGRVDTRSTTGGLTGPVNTRGGIRITNGTDNSTGGIVVSNSTSILVRNSASKSGWIILNARKGKISLQGNLNASGIGDNMAGNVILLADSVEANDGTIVTASQTDAAPASGHQVAISAKTVTYSGTGGLKLLADGNGVDQVVSVYLLPYDNLRPISTDSVINLVWSFEAKHPIGEYDAELNLNGGASAPLIVSANGDNTEIFVSAYPIKVTGGDATFRARGKENHNITMGYFAGFLAKTGLLLENTGRTVLNASATDGGKGGKINVLVDYATFKSELVSIRADGPDTGDGDGGTVFFNATGLDMLVSRAIISADAAEQGTGNADPDEAIFLNSTQTGFSLGTQTGQIQVLARGGGSDGNGGKVFVVGNSISANSKRSIDVSARAGDGNGGEIVIGDGLKRLRVNNDNAQTIKGIGMGTGTGGRLTAYHIAPVFDINKTIDLDGGTMLPIGGKDGFMQLNDVQCQKWKLKNNFPRSYWNCVNPNAPDAMDEVPLNTVHGLNNAARIKLRDKHYQLYYFSDAAAYNTFFSDNEGTFIGGLTFEFLTEGGSLVSNIFAQGPDEANNIVTWDSNQLAEVAAHETGHAMDIVYDNYTQKSNFVTYVLRDLVNFDYSVVGSDRNSSTPREPCTVFAGATFYNPINQQRVNICTGGVLHSFLASNTNSNSEILTYMDSGIWSGPMSDPPFYFETQAQIFAFRLVGAKGARPSTDQVLSNSGGSYFPCMKSLADYVRSGGDNPPVPGACGTAESWYTPGHQF